MTNSHYNNIDVKAIDSDTTSELQKASAEAITNGTKTVGLNFPGTTGNIPAGISSLEIMHKSDVDFITHGSGELTLGAVIPLAGGKFGERTAEAIATFNLIEDSTKAGKKRKTLTAGEKNALEILDKLSGGRKARIKAFMLSGSKVTASEMLSLNLIDKIEGGFVDRYEKERKDAKEKAKNDKKK